MSQPLLRISHLEVRYGDLIGVADVSLEVPQGSVVALLGSNGAGKTTTLNAIAGIVPVSKGEVNFAGENIAGQPAYAIVRKGLALSPEGWRLFTQQSVENNLLLGATPLHDKSRKAVRQLELGFRDVAIGVNSVVGSINRLSAVATGVLGAAALANSSGTVTRSNCSFRKASIRARDACAAAAFPPTCTPWPGCTPLGTSLRRVTGAVASKPWYAPS